MNIFIKSLLGTGKTQLVCDWIRDYFTGKFIVFVSARKSFT